MVGRGGARVDGRGRGRRHKDVVRIGVRVGVVQGAGAKERLGRFRRHLETIKEEENGYIRICDLWRGRRIAPVVGYGVIAWRMIDGSIVLYACGAGRLVQVFGRIKPWTIGGLW